MQEEKIIKVSIIVAVYNVAKYLKQCLDSIAGQTLREIEIICVNDGSTDHSLSILEEYAAKDERFRIFTKENEGLGAASARNLGLDHARGEYISILDSDDFFELEMLEKAVRKADETAADIVVFGGCQYDNKNNRFTRVASILNDAVVPEKDVFSCHDCPDKIYQLSQGMAWNKLFRKSFLDMYHLRFQRIKYTDDAYFTFAHMALAKKIAVVRDALCYYRVNTGTNQTAGISNYPDSAYSPYIELKKSLSEWGLYDTVKRSFVNCAATFMRRSYDQIDRYEPFQYLHDKYREEVFDALDISDQPKDFFYDGRVYLWRQKVMECSAGELAFQCARAYGSEFNTGILRFQIPANKIPRGSKIVLVGDGVVGQYFYAQSILSTDYDVVLWVSSKDSGPCSLSCIKDLDALRNVDFDYALVVYMNQKMVDDAILYLKSIHVPDEKIVLGGNIT